MALSISAIVPMRASSERVKNKNIRSFNGRPLYHFIINTLIDCNVFDSVIIDTDIEAIKTEAPKKFPQIKIIERPDHLKAGKIPMNNVLHHSLQQVDSEFILQTHSTNPLIGKHTILKAIETFQSSYPGNDSLFSVTPLQMRFWDRETKPINHNPGELLRTQDLEPMYFENSCFYIFNRENFLKIKNRIGENPKMFKMNKIESFDIDDMEDFRIAESLQKF
ncbi:acylneuraminate cytidylyltransferase family protein [Caldithrix abyssi]|nr:acylneuraminate cytidylyltransferase family protein [Caldithrix abyssi]